MASERTQRQIDRLLDEAEEAFSRGEWEPLHERANRRLLLDPENSDARNSVAAAERAFSGDAQSQPAHVAPQHHLVSNRRLPCLLPSQAAATRSRSSFGQGGKRRVYLAHDDVPD